MSTENSEGIYEILFKIREFVKPTDSIEPDSCLKVENECSVLECCFSEVQGNRGRVREGGEYFW